MLRPSYAELIQVVNRGMEEDNMITSRYTIVIAAAKRARQLIDGQDPLTYAPTDKAVSIAVNEMYQNKLKISIPKDKELSEYPMSHTDTGFEAMMDEYGEQ